MTFVNAGSESLFIFKNHCKETRGSITAPVRSDVPTLDLYSSSFSMCPASSSSLMIFFRATKRSSPTKIWARSFNFPSSVKISTTSSPCFSPNAKSLGSCAGVTFKQPVPKSIVTYSSAIIGICFPINGMLAF